MVSKGVQRSATEELLCVSYSRNVGSCAMCSNWSFWRSQSYVDKNEARKSSLCK